MCTQDSIQQFTQSQLLSCRAAINQKPQSLAHVEGAVCKKSFATRADVQHLIEVTSKHNHRDIPGPRTERSPLAELNGDPRVNSDTGLVGNKLDLECQRRNNVDSLPDMAMSLCTPLTPPRRTGRSEDSSASRALEAELDELIWEGFRADAARQVSKDAQANDQWADMAMSMCTPLSMPMSMCTPLSQADMALSLCTPATQAAGVGGQNCPEAIPPPFSLGEDIFRQPAELLRTVALQVATTEAQSAFGWNRVKLFQKRAIQAWAAGRNCFLLSGTGSGKTGCFVLPALVARRWHQRQGAAACGPSPMAIVVSPIVALMRDQVGRLQKHGIAATVLSPQCDDPHAWQRALSGEVVLLYTVPEKLIKLVETGELQKLPRVSLLAIDEAHCVSEWGFSFRPEYGWLNRIIAAVAKTGYGGRTPPVLCVTATCTGEVREDTIRSLGLKADETDLVTGTMNRPNLYFSVEEWPDERRMERRLLEMFDVASVDQRTAHMRRVAALDTAMPNSRSTTIVYAQRKRHCDQLARLLGSGGVRAAAYHSSLSHETKNLVQEAFTLGRLQVVVATVAFGMGIDKPDVRRVIHYGMPKCLEAYSQESGRAGRDGEFACCTILYTPFDRAKGESAILKENPVPTPTLQRSLARLQKIHNYCRDNRRCRRAQLLEYLGENPCDMSSVVNSQPMLGAGTPGYCAATTGGPFCGRCDTCCSTTSAPALDLQSELLTVLQSAQALGTCARKQLIEMAYEATAGTKMKKDAWSRIVDAAVNEGFIDVCVALHRSYAVHSLSDQGRARLRRGHINEHFFVDVGISPTTRPCLNLPVWQLPPPEIESLEAKELRLQERSSIVDDEKSPNASERKVPYEAACPEHSSHVCPMASHAWFSSAVKWNRSGSSGTVPEEANIDCLDPQADRGAMVLAEQTAKRPLTIDITGQSPATRRLRRSGSSGDQMEVPVHRAASSSSSTSRPPGSFGDQMEFPMHRAASSSSSSSTSKPLDFSRKATLKDDCNDRGAGSSDQQSSLINRQMITLTVLDSDEDSYHFATAEEASQPSMDAPSPASTNGVLLDDVAPKRAYSRNNVLASHEDTIAKQVANAHRKDAGQQEENPNVSIQRLDHASVVGDQRFQLQDRSRSRSEMQTWESRGRHRSEPVQRKRSLNSLQISPGPSNSLQISPSCKRKLSRSQSSLQSSLQDDKSQKRRKYALAKRRTRSYTEAERASASPFVAKLMEAADFNSNAKGGSAGFKQLMQQVLRLSPPELRQSVNEVLAVFQAKTIAVHGNKLDEIIDSLRTGNQK